MASKRARDSFPNQAQRILDLPIAHRVNRLGGYGPNLEVIYDAHPAGCPSVLVDSQRDATVSFMSNGSVAFAVKLAEGMEVSVLDASWDISEKREIRVPSQNLWLDVAVGRRRAIASLINPRVNLNSPPAAVRVVKVAGAERAMWYCATFAPGGGIRYQTAVKLSFVYSSSGPAVLRQVFVRNAGSKPLTGRLWSHFNLHGTQRFVYNKDLWYDMGLPVSLRDTVVSATVPYSSILQIKRVSSRVAGLRAIDATCDYASFVGDTSAPVVLPEAVLAGAMRPGGAGRRLNRFSTPTIAAGQFDLSLSPGESGTLQQSLLYVTDPEAIERFREQSAADAPTYPAMSRAFGAAAKSLVAGTADVGQCVAATVAAAAEAAPLFEVALPAEPTVSAYANSVWTGVKELYENCRAHGARLANGIELGTRDRAQDMWPKMKEDPARVRADLVHAMSMMYVTVEKPPTAGGRRKLTLREKLHGMFPRQYPSRWDDRSQEIFNDNRPYNDSASWLLNSINMYVRETGDVSLLAERVKTVRLTNPDKPETSGLVGAEPTFRIVEVMLEVLECLARHAADSPYGLVQILYGDWCDPIDMYGTGVVGDATTRGQGRGVQVRLSGHVFVTAVETIDLLTAPSLSRMLGPAVATRVDLLKKFADRLRHNAVRWAWEPGENAGFVAAIHELRADGSTPDYAAGEIGYTLGSMRGRDFDGVNRRDLVTQAYALAMLTTQRDYLTPLPQAGEIAAAVMNTVNTLFYSPKLGLSLFTTPISNNKRARDLVGRMGVVPAGTAENGEYHHGQVMMHRFRLGVAGQADRVWQQFKPMMSVSRDESLAGPFETPCTSYASDKHDPHFGKGMYFGLSGSVDWIVEVFQKIAGVELNLHDDRKPAVAVQPTLPRDLQGELTYRRVIHRALPGGGYQRIPLTVRIAGATGPALAEGMDVTINGKPAGRAELASLDGVDRVEIELTPRKAGR